MAWSSRYGGNDGVDDAFARNHLSSGRSCDTKPKGIIPGGVDLLVVRKPMTLAKESER
ncbi:hypothetical protein [Burkholderia ubonensis]|uniref:hypothetical protein n=1 Tax=Burkholderia ubonensis TaxID=101571 RepID=UPI000ABA1AC0|nr:hypothetical protein [Burkholderia ubonensis]